MKRAWVVLLLSASTTAAAAEELKWYDRFEFGGFVDMYYAFNTNRPASQNNFIPGEGTDGKKSNQFGLGLAALELHVKSPVIVHLVINYGTATEVEHVNEPTGDYIGPNVWKFIQQAYLGYKIPIGRGLKVELGIFPCHIGFEDFNSKNNWNYTRGWVAENQPYYQTGIKLSYPFTDRFTAQFFYLNGWQNVGENNNWKTFGSSLLYALPKVSFFFNTLIGPEQPNDHDHWRFLFDGIVVADVTPKLSLALNPDYGFEQMPTGDLAHWWGVAVFARYSPLAWMSWAARAEYFHDGLGSRVMYSLTGTEQTLWEGTLTFEVRPVDRLIVRLEGRYDYSDKPVFEAKGFSSLTNMPNKSNDEGLIVFAAVATF
jgi:hypothetical protein